MDALLVGAITLTAILLFVREVFPPDIVAVLVLGSLVLFGLVTPREAVSGFSSSATLAVGAMFVLSAGLRETGALDGVARVLTRVGINGPLLMLSTMLMVAAISGTGDRGFAAGRDGAQRRTAAWLGAVPHGSHHNRFGDYVLDLNRRVGPMHHAQEIPVPEVAATSLVTQDSASSRT